MIPTPKIVIPRGNEASAMRSPRDSDAVARQWQKHNRVAFQDSAATRAISKLQRDVEKLRRRIIGGTPEELPASYFPLCVYNVPAGYCADSAKQLRSFRVRDGLVSTRSLWHTTVSGNSHGSEWLTDYGIVTDVNGTDNIIGSLQASGQESKDDYDYQTTRLLPADDYTVVEMTDNDTVYRADGPTEFVLGTQTADSEMLGATFWVEIADSADELTVALCAQMWAKGFTVPRDPFPWNSNGIKVIPLAIVRNDNTDSVTPVNSIDGCTLSVQQFTFDHVLPGMLTNVFGNIFVDNSYTAALPMTYRGYQDADAGTTNLTGQIIWPGDCVWYTTTVAGIKYNRLYQRTGGVYSYDSNPTSAIGWNIIFAARI